MARNSNFAVDFAAGWLNSQLTAQPWWKEYSNTVTTAAGFLATVAAWAGSQAFAADPRVQTALLIVGFLLTVVGVKNTPNGWTQSQAAQLNAARADFIDSNHSCGGGQCSEGRYED